MWFRRRRTTAPRSNDSWIDGQFIVIDLGDMRVSHRGEETHGGVLSPPDDAKILRFLGELCHFRYSQRSKSVSLLDERDGMREETGVTADNRFLRLRIVESRDPLTATAAVSTCWQRATGRELIHQDLPRT